MSADVRFDAERLKI